jgi:hypothetical protein
VLVVGPNRNPACPADVRPGDHRRSGASVRRHHRRCVEAVLAIAAVVVTGCGGTDAPPPGGNGSGSDPQVGAPTYVSVRCGGSAYDPAAVTDAPPASSLSEGSAGAVDDVGDPEGA